MLSLRDGMGSGWAGKFFCRRRRRPPKMCVLGETVSFAKGSNMRDLGAILYRHSDRTDAAVLFLDSEKHENPKKS